MFENFFVCRRGGVSLAHVRSNCDYFKQSEITANPDTMKRVYEALAQISNMPWEHSESPYATVAREALKLLDTP